MKRQRRLIFSAVVIVGLSCWLSAQQRVSAQTASVVPQLVNYSGKAIDAAGKPLAGIAGATFAIYAEQSGGAPLWMETQNIQADAKGNYVVQLGATSADGLPLELFASGQARWLGVRVNGSEEQPRVLLLSVPYALKAADAQTLGGLPASAFLLAGAANAAGPSSDASANAATNSVTPAVSGTGKTDFIPLWTNTTGALGDSVLFQTGTGTTARIGVNSTTPASTLDVNGAVTARGNLSLPASGAASTTAGKNSQPLTFTASSYNSSAGAAVNQNFRWQAEPTGNNSNATGGTLNLLYGAGGNTPAETGLKVAKNGQISFAAGQTFPIATGGVTNGMLQNSSVTITPGTALTGGGKIALGGSATLNVDTTRVPLLTSANVFSSGQTFTGGLISTTTGYIPLLAEAPESGFGTALEMQTTGTSGMSWQILNTGAGASQGANKLNFRNDSAGLDVMTMAANGNVGIGTTIPGANLDMSGGLTVNGNGATLFSTQYEGVNAFAMNTEPSLNGVGQVLGNGWTLYDYAYGKWVAGISQVDGAVGINQGSPSYALDVLAENGGTYAAFFGGNIDVDGTVSTASASLQIDDPVDPANKYLYHSSVESPDMMNIYNGNVTTDAAGNATVQMPDWFEALNRDFRYQLTVIGQPSQAYISQELASGAFSIKTDKPNVKVSWQVTGIRQDAWANAHRMPVEVQKSAVERGNYLHPELFGAAQNKKIPVRQLRKVLGMKPPAQFSQTKQLGMASLGKNSPAPVRKQN
jgi:trimeric autotransporter adhesin